MRGVLLTYKYGHCKQHGQRSAALINASTGDRELLISVEQGYQIVEL